MSSRQNSFITNQERFLGDIVNNILPKSEAVNMLVGYFYYSGYELIAEQLKDKEVKILVGMDIDSEITKHINDIEFFDQAQKSRGQMRDDYYQQLVKIFNESDLMDSEPKLKSFTMFYEKIKDGTLQIRKTEEACHAKMYLFTYNDNVNEGGEEPGCVITGSSNLTYSGLKGRLEINARFNDKNSYYDGMEIFDQLWETSIIVADDSIITEFDEKVIKKIWYDKLYSPYLMYIRVLSEYFAIPSDENILTPHDITEGRYHNLKYQTDAVQLTLQSIKNHNGAIVADVVGLGKSIIASTVARNLKLRTIIIAPPHLVRQWEMYKDEFGFTATVFSSGMIESALKYYLDLVKTDEQFLIIIDEAHRYRNEYTQDYGNLHNLCSGNKVILLTATPFNNRPDDIFSMLKLFQIPSESTLNTVDNLGGTFKKLIQRYKDLVQLQRDKKIDKENANWEIQLIARHIRSIISPLVIRRSRLDLQEIPEYQEDLKRQNIVPVLPEDPIEQDYNLGGLEKLYVETLDLIDGAEEKNDGAYRFKAARYSPVAYVIEGKFNELSQELEELTGEPLGLLVGRQSNISKFMRRLLVRRFESSVYAFKSSLEYMIASGINILNWIDKTNKIPVYKKGVLPSVEDFYETSDDGLTEIEGAFERYADRGFFSIDMKYINDSFVSDVQADISLLKSIHEKWFGKEDKIIEDPKLESFKEILKTYLTIDPERKLIVFSEFADTVDYIGKALQDAGLPVMKYTSADASNTNKEKIRLNFDAGVKSNLQQDDYKILIATDAISEGYNLHRAGAILNYDIPYNPTRVIQRIGRINRINKKMFDKLFIYNYFPTNVGESETRTKAISTLKMAMIHAIMGEDTKVLTKEEELQAFFKEQYIQEMSSNEELSWDSKYRKLLNLVKGTDAYNRAIEIPPRAKTGRQVDKTHQGVLVFGKKGNDYVFKIGNKSEIKALSAEEAFTLFEASPNEQAQKLTKNYDITYQAVKAKLFESDVQEKEEKDLITALQKIKLVASSGKVDKDYIADLITVLRKDALSGYEIRLINKLTPKEYTKLPKYISQDYLNRIIATSNAIENGEESLILSQEIIK
ncbi:helicase-related protein [Porphyromonas levii]|uniref:helicase-related protein n=1 Tax=Porphyromonas levii TaxID=28114 RepID=UPI001B8B665F|nr:helicase-related protein [Porphyromonas levii]MBR8713641.1 RNA polymerase-associated protein RapA [Porphyromonas levii]MBR8715620.1 RNA polymerase-associated protein RapA [Porphyromonas levii]MBR8728194.1 RNA polymerase-associated protein RapA [Porphyromonas levii]MBR8736548.1 RNA polymerase-associated protein RapA [Porphyromonas levii]MBR8764143.1 RNA polymerase-associated protein RapA [Porphyromonas levii]